MPVLTARSVVTFSVAKRLEDPASCQDACAANDRLGLYAIADGLTQSFFPAEWASLIVSRFCGDAVKDQVDALFADHDWQAWLESIQEQWRKVVQDVLESTQAPIEIRRRLPKQDPAASTWIGLQLLCDANPSESSWRAVIVGDSVLFHVREGTIHGQYMIANSTEFGNYPQFVGSYAKDCIDEPAFISGEIRDGDAFVLATDAFAKWLIQQWERSSKAWSRAWEALLSLDNWDSFYEFVRGQQRDRCNRLDDDDIAVVVVSVSGDKPRSEDAFSRFFDQPVSPAELSGDDR